MREGPHYKRCRMRVSPLAGRFETKRGEVFGIWHDNISSARPLTDLSSTYVVQGLILFRVRKHARAQAPAHRLSTNKRTGLSRRYIKKNTVFLSGHRPK